MSKLKQSEVSKICANIFAKFDDPFDSKEINKNFFVFAAVLFSQIDFEIISIFIPDTLYYLSIKIERRVSRDCMLGPIKLLKNSLVAIPSYAINHDPSFFQKPDQYEPTRFLNNNNEQQTVNPDVFLPFAAGPRSCIGKRLALLEIKICLISLLTHYRFSVSLETKIPLEHHIGQPVSSPKEVKVMVTPRTRLNKQD